MLTGGSAEKQEDTDVHNELINDVMNNTTQHERGVDKKNSNASSSSKSQQQAQQQQAGDSGSSSGIPLIGLAKKIFTSVLLGRSEEADQEDEENLLVEKNIEEGGEEEERGKAEVGRARERRCGKIGSNWYVLGEEGGGGEGREKLVRVPCCWTSQTAPRWGLEVV